MQHAIIFRRKKMPRRIAGRYIFASRDAICAFDVSHLQGPSFSRRAAGDRRAAWPSWLQTQNHNTSLSFLT